MTRFGTSHFVSFTKACDYYRDYDPSLTPAELERRVRTKIDEGEIHLGKPALKTGERLLVIDGGARYAIER